MSDMMLSVHEFNGKSLARVSYKGRDAIIAQQFGAMLGYSDDGARLVSMITNDWANEFREGPDYDILQGYDLHALKQLATGAVGSHAPRQMLLYLSGYDKVRLLTKKPIGKQLRQAIVDTIFPSLRETGRLRDAWCGPSADRTGHPARAAGGDADSGSVHLYHDG